MTGHKIRIAKLLANYNQGSRREIEQLIKDKKIFLNKKLVTTPITFASTNDEIYVNKKKITFIKKNEVLKFFKPKDIICSKKKQDDRKIIYEILKPKYKNYIFAGRLDFKSEGLIILSNSSLITRNLELPTNKFIRKYEVRAYGSFDLNRFEKVSKGIKVNKIFYKPFKYKIKSKIKKNTNIEISLIEGKKNEIRNIFKFLDLKVNKLKRISYGPFVLDNMLPGELKKAKKSELEKYENYFRYQKR